MTSDARDDEGAVRRGLRRMGHAVVPVEDPERVDERRERLAPRLATFADAVFEADERRAKRRRTFVVASVAALAFAAMLVLGARAVRAPAESAAVRSASGTVLVGRPGAEDAAGRVPRALASDDHVRTREGRAEVSLPSGAVVTVQPMSDLALANGPARADGDDRIALGAGVIRVSVPQLTHGRHLVVATPNAVVTVHGTVFVVEVAGVQGGMPTTRVSVTEGRVSVASGGREIFLDPGASWSSGTAEVAPAPPSAAASVALDELPRASDSAEARPGAALPPSTLSAENELFRQALAARKAGNPARAVSLLDQLLAKYPTSPLVGEARAERQRATLDAERGRGVGSRP